MVSGTVHERKIANHWSFIVKSAIEILNIELRIMDTKISFSQITKISKKGNARKSDRTQQNR